MSFYIKILKQGGKYLNHGFFIVSLLCLFNQIFELRILF